MARAIELKKGNVFTFRESLWKVLNTQHTSHGKKGGYVQIKMKRLQDGHIETERFASSDDVEKAFLESRKMEYLYQEDNLHVFMDPRTGDQVTVHKGDIADILPYLDYNCEAEVTFHEGRPVEVNLPPSVTLEVAQTEPAVRGDTATNVTKPATLSTGLVVKVPGHIKTGDEIQVDIRTGEFMGRA